ncbi:Hsp70 family protein [Dactylosporangium sp. NPDC050588]|uniref:Hsp70 family protein n=1 Tax=Dactylosporangium sp. NPDC050588 TaxID=3157211 RepID=UPI0033E0EF86
MLGGGARRRRPVTEPVAAATNFAAGTRVEAGQAVVVYDLGAGTFDVSVVRRTGSAFEALAYRGLDDLGGLDLDALVVAHAAGTVTDGEASAWRGVTEPGDADGRRQHRALWDDARETKEALSRQPSAGFHVTALRRDVLVTRDEFERAAGPLLQRTVDLTLDTIRESRAKPDQIAGGVPGRRGEPDTAGGDAAAPGDRDRADAARAAGAGRRPGRPAGRRSRRGTGCRAGTVGPRLGAAYRRSPRLRAGLRLRVRAGLRTTV